MKRFLWLVLALCMISLAGCGAKAPAASPPNGEEQAEPSPQDTPEGGAEALPAETVQAADNEIVLRVCNWEEYIDLGDWDEEEELIELDNGTQILGVNPMYEDFEDWYYETTGKKSPRGVLLLRNE